MNLVLSFVIIFTVSIAHAGTTKEMAVNGAKGPQALVGQNSAGELTYFVPGPNGQLKEVNLAFFEGGLEKSIEFAKKVVCEMNILPQSVTVSSVVVSVTYDTKQFCSKKN